MELVQNWEAVGVWYEIGQIIPLIFLGCMIVYVSYIVFKKNKNVK